MSEALPKLTREAITQSRVIAKGTRIRDVGRLVATYGGRSSKWLKKSSRRFEVDGTQYEYHWYEHHGVGKVEMKRKRVNQP